MGADLTTCVLGDKRSRTKSHLDAWRRKLMTHKRDLQRQIVGLERAEKATAANARAAHKRNDSASVRLLAGEIARARRQREILAIGVARCDYAVATLRHQIVQASLQDAMVDSVRLMRALNRLYSLEATRAIAVNLQREMARHDMIQEQLSDIMDIASDNDPDDTDEAQQVLAQLTDDEVSAKAAEIMKELLANMPATPKKASASKSVEIELEEMAHDVRADDNVPLISRSVAAAPPIND